MSNPARPHFDGETYDPEQDHERLTRQLDRVRAALIEANGGWLTLADLAQRATDPEASVSARLRDLRKEKFGAWIVDARRDENDAGLWWYRIRLRMVDDPAPETKGSAIARLRVRVRQLEAENAQLREQIPKQGRLF